MMNEDIEKIYQDLTGVDISEQYYIWDERGKGYYGEYLVFKTLYPSVDGVCKFLMNIIVPTETGRTTEIDLLMIHETGLYVFEIKHYKGTIYGKAEDTTWTQYFRTARNNTFQNPILQNDYHIKALRNMFPTLPIYSCVVFTSRDCELKVNVLYDDVMVCTLYELTRELNGYVDLPHIMDMEQIDAAFCKLTEYSPMMQQNVNFEGVIVPLYLYVNNIKSDYEIAKQQLKQRSRNGFVVTIICILFASQFNSGIIIILIGILIGMCISKNQHRKRGVCREK